MKDALEFIQNAKSFLVTTHDFPDGDGLGSQLALHRALLALGKESHAINSSPTPEKFSLVDPDGRISVYNGRTPLPPVDAILIVDTNEMKMMGPMEAPLRALRAPVCFIDHHVPDNLSKGPHYVDENFAATGELVYSLIEALGVKIDSEMATGLYVAILTDTGSFRYKRTSSLSHRIVAELLDCGVAPEQVYRSIFAHETPEKTRYLGHTLEGLQTSADGKVAWLCVLNADRKHYGATIEDTESFVGFLTLLKGVEIAALFREEEDGRVKVSLRGMGVTPVIDIARAFGGGGHRFAAGARVAQPLHQVQADVLARCQVALKADR